MSLKAFHIVFIVVSILLSFGVGVWGIYTHLSYSNVTFLIMGIVSFIIGIALIIYGINFMKKLKHIGYL